jgi:bifunctional non-homologous end joining protein LigD
MNPADKSLAVRTEDHPLEYAKFEGVIPPGQYGTGTVMVCDLGKYESPEDRPPEEQLASGKIHVVLQGEKLCGAFTSIKFERQSRIPAGETTACSSKAATSRLWDIESPRFDYSVLTGRTLEEIRDGKPIKRRSARRRV